MIHAALIAAILAAQPLQEPGPNRYDAVCDGREASKAELYEHRLRELQEWRRDMGMPSSRGHIAALLRSKAAHKRSQKLDAGLDGPVTVREYRYLKARGELYGYDLALPYFKGARRAYYYGVGIEDDWPREPRVGIYVTRNVAKVQRDLTRRARGRYKVKVVRVRHSLRELQRIQKRIDWEALAAEGIEVSSTGIGDNEVHVDANSARPDAKAVIEQRYGKAVKATIDPPPVDREICSAASTYSVSPDGLKVTASGSTGGSETVTRIVLNETPTAVSIGAVVLFPASGGSFDETTFNAEVTLSAPLGDRQVLDGETGHVLRKSTGGLQ